MYSPKPNIQTDIQTDVQLLLYITELARQKLTEIGGIQTYIL